MAVVVFLSGCRRTTDQNIEAPHIDFPSLETEEFIDVVEATKNEMVLETDTWDIDVGSSQTVLFTLTAEDLSSTPVLLEDDVQIASFEGTDDGIYVCETVLSSQVRMQKHYSAVCDGIKSNELLISFYQAISDEEQEQMNVFAQSVRDAYASNASNTDPTEEELVKAINAVVPVLNKGIEDGILSSWEFLGEDFLLIYSNGLRKVVSLFTISGQWGSPSEEVIEWITAENATEDGVETGKRKVGLFQPYYYDAEKTTNHQCDILEEISETIEDNYSNYMCDLKRQVCLEDLLHFNDYDIVVWEGHSAGKGRFLPIVVDEKEAKALCDQSSENPFREDINTRILIGVDYDKVFVTPDFFDKYYKNGNMDGMLIWFGVCTGTGFEHDGSDGGFIRNTFTDKGAAMCITTTGEVSFAYLDTMMKTFFTELSHGKTVLESFTKAKEKNGKYDIGVNDWLSKLEDKTSDVLYTILFPNNAPRAKTEFVIIDNPNDMIDPATYVINRNEKVDFDPDTLKEYAIMRMNQDFLSIRTDFWDSIDIYPGQVGDATMVEASEGMTRFGFVFDGYLPENQMTPKEMSIYTDADYGEVCLFGNIFNGMTYEQTVIAMEYMVQQHSGSGLIYRNLGGREEQFADYLTWEITDPEGHGVRIEYGFLKENPVLNQFHITKIGE